MIERALNPRFRFIIALYIDQYINVATLQGAQTRVFVTMFFGLAGTNQAGPSNPLVLREYRRATSGDESVGLAHPREHPEQPMIRVEGRVGSAIVVN